MDYLLTYYDRGFSGNPYDAGNDKTYSMDSLPQEFPSLGTGDYRTPACIIKNTDRTYCSDFRYESHCIKDGKYNLEGLPAVYAGAEEAQTLEVVLVDRVTGVRAVLLYGVLPEFDVITRSVKIINGSDGRISVKKLSPASLDMVGGNYDFITFYGRHAMERAWNDEDLQPERILQPSVQSGGYRCGARYNRGCGRMLVHEFCIQRKLPE